MQYTSLDVYFQNKGGAVGLVGDCLGDGLVHAVIKLSTGVLISCQSRANWKIKNNNEQILVHYIITSSHNFNHSKPGVK